MKKALLYGPFDLRIADVPCPEPGPRQALVRVHVSSPYGTDFKFYDGTLAPAPYPLGFGGDFAGEVVTVGDDVESVRVGDRVAASASRHCGDCRMCRSGRENLCVDNPNPSQAFAHGFSEYAVLDANRLATRRQLLTIGAGVGIKVKLSAWPPNRRVRGGDRRSHRRELSRRGQVIPPGDGARRTDTVQSDADQAIPSLRIRPARRDRGVTGGEVGTRRNGHGSID